MAKKAQICQHLFPSHLLAKNGAESVTEIICPTGYVWISDGQWLFESASTTHDLGCVRRPFRFRLQQTLKPCPLEKGGRSKSKRWEAAVSTIAARGKLSCLIF